MSTFKKASRVGFYIVLTPLIVATVFLVVSLFWFSETQAVKPPKPTPEGDLEIVSASNKYHVRHCFRMASFVLLSADGGRTKSLLNECDCLLWDPAWSPDGSRIVYRAFHSACTGGIGLNTVKNDGKDIRHIITADARGPAWSPVQDIEDNYWIAYSDELASGGEPDIMRIPVDSLGDPLGASVNLTNTPEVRERCPTWSPDANYLAYTRRNIPAEYPVFTPSVIVLHDLVSDVTYEIEGPYPDNGTIHNVDWARTGDKLVIFTTPFEEIDGGWIRLLGEIWVIDLTTDPMSYIQVVTGISCCANGEGVSPSWSPDDTKIVYKIDGGIWVCNSDGSGTPTMISDEVQGSPDWKR